MLSRATQTKNWSSNLQSGIAPALLASIICALLLFSLDARAADPTGGHDFFESKIRPILVEHCYKCHSAESEKIKGGLRLDTRETLLKGGDSGPGIIPEKADLSLLIKAVRYQEEELRMPPKVPLSPEKVAALVAWVNMGAPDPRSGSANQSIRPDATAENHWAFKPPVASPPPRVATKNWAKTPIDNFVLDQLESKKLSPSPDLDRRRLIRRVTYGLHGLPPTPEHVEIFLQDQSPEAYEKLIDRLLASPRYGERWGRHWLDVARYSDTKGYVYSDREEVRYLHSYAYRDWVINALNRDLPYDQFLRLQIAADQMKCDATDLAAMGFLTLGRRFLGVMPDIIDDRIDVLTRGTMGMTVSCARCHNHKFDPVSIRDYYSLYGVFQASTETSVPLPSPSVSDEARKTYETGLQTRAQAYTNKLVELSEKLAQRIRSRTGDYLDSQLRLDQFPNEDFYEILAPEDLNPAFVRRWQEYLFKSSQTFDPVFSPWHELMRLKDENFQEEARITWEKLKSENRRQINGLVQARLDAGQLRAKKDLVLIYTELFREILVRETNTVPESNSLPLEAAVPALRDVLFGSQSPTRPPDGNLADLQFYFEEESRVQLGKLEKEIDSWKVTSEGSPPHAGVLVDRANPKTARVFKRGNPGNPGEEVPRKFLEFFAGTNQFKNGSGRLELAQLISSPSNPLTARVLVNRVWMHHFGQGLMKTPSDFGLRSEPPSHPALLDYLASRFVADGWSLKKLHRLILLSRVYQQESRSDLQVDPNTAAGVERTDRARLEDPENRLLWRMPRQRLDFESTRDSLLAGSGEIDLTMGGRSIPIFENPLSRRRTVYGYVDRQFLPGVFRVFDFANPDLHIPQRHQTTVPQQALFFLNNRLIMESAHALAKKRSSPNFEQDLHQLYRTLFQRTPTSAETDRAVEFFQDAKSVPAPIRTEPPASAWQYGYGKVDPISGEFKSFSQLPHFEKVAWQGGPSWPDSRLGWLQLKAESGHPGNDLDHAVVRRWTAPHDTVIKIQGELSHPSKEGDGVHASIVTPRGVVASWLIHNQKTRTELDNIQILKGESVSFVVDCAKNLGYDDFKWAPVIIQTGKKENDPEGDQVVEWSAKKDFASPFEKLPEPLDAWSAYAQILLASNEFMFID